jgi:hypothetical protein
MKASEFKVFTALEVKDASKGEVRAVVATMGVVDREGDIIMPTAIKSGTNVIVSSYGHDAVYGNRPVGKGVLGVKDGQAIFDGRLFLNTSDGRDTFEVLKEMGSAQEWSFGFMVMGEEVPNDMQKKQGARRVLTKLDAFEVSPVLMGAGIGTQTLGVKAVVGEQADGAGEAPSVAVVEAVPVVETKVDPLVDIRAQLKTARQTVAELETKEANLIAGEIFTRFQRNMQRAKA